MWTENWVCFKCQDLCSSCWDAVRKLDYGNEINTLKAPNVVFNEEFIAGAALKWNNNFVDSEEFSLKCATNTSNYIPAD